VTESKSDNIPAKNASPLEYQLASPSDPKSTSPVGTNPYKSNTTELAMTDGSPLNKPAPEVDLPDLNGSRFQLANHRGVNIVVLDFWATWCVPCVRELPALTRVMRSYEDKGVVFRAVNVDEDRAVINAFLKSSHLEAPISLDDGGKLADAFGAQTLPLLVLIDKAGVVRGMHWGEIESPGTVLAEDLDAILENRPLPKRSTAVLADNGGSSSGFVHGVDPHSDIMTEGTMTTTEKNPIQVHSHGKADWRLTLESGRVIDVGKIFAEERAKLEERLQAAYDAGRFLRVNHQSTNTPFLLVSRRQGSLTGPLASFYEDGSPTAYMQYNAGRRTSAMLTWDKAKRPLVFEQYKDGQKDGVRCLFKACADNCPQGHLWMVQEWSKGSIQQAHVVPPDGKPITFEYANGKPIPRDDVSTDDFELAMAKFDEFDDKVAANEKELKLALGQLNRQERQALSAMRRAAAAQRRSQMMASIGSSMRGGYSMPSVSTRSCSSGG
jgi:thiol-disulfide isomerase/thioredoxin